MVALLERYGAKAPKYDLKAAFKMWLDEESGDSAMVFKEVEDNVTEADVAWDEDWLRYFPKANDVPMARRYLDARRVPKQVATALDIRWDIQRRAVSFPIRNWAGELVGLRGRYIASDSAARYHDYEGPCGVRNKLPWYGEHFVDVDSPVVMVESVFDLASVYKVYPNVLAPLTVGLSRSKCARVRGVFEIVTLFDNGKGGDKGRSKLSQRLPKSVITHLRPPTHRDDPGDMRKKELRKVLGKHIVLDAR